MDEVYGCYNLHASPQIPLNDYFVEYSNLLKSSLCYDRNHSVEENIFHLMGVELSKARLDLMSHYCSVHNLRSEETTSDEESRDNIRAKLLENISDSTQLETLKTLKKCDMVLLQRYNIQNGISIIYEKLHNDVENITPGQDFLVYVQVYEPFNSSMHRYGKHYKNILPILRIKSVISILGCQYLTELREKIMCVSDLSVAAEVSKNPDKLPNNLAKNIYKSGFFFIENTFYNDMRDASNNDYSDIIIKWAATKNLGPFKTARMEDIQINSLCARFGFPWVYMHQGHCEHLIVLSDARLVTQDDNLSISSYPKIEKIKPIVGKNCSMCGILNVRWIVTEHSRIPHDTSYFCQNCFKSYNYVDGKKIGNFKAYRYPCLPELMRQNIKNY